MKPVSLRQNREEQGAEEAAGREEGGGERGGGDGRGRGVNFMHQDTKPSPVQTYTAICSAPGGYVSASVVLALGIPFYYLVSQGMWDNPKSWVFLFFALCFFGLGIYIILLSSVVRLNLTEEGISIIPIVTLGPYLTWFISAGDAPRFSMRGRRMRISPYLERSIFLILWTSPREFLRAARTWSYLTKVEAVD